MTDVVFVFEVHQPHRLRRNLFWEGKVFRRYPKMNYSTTILILKLTAKSLSVPHANATFLQTR